MSTLRVTNIEDLAGNPVFSLSGGNMTVAGNLTVQGTTTSIETTNLVIEDKNIVLGLTDPAATDATADGGGITLKGSTDKTIAWIDSTNAWTSSEYLSLPNGVAEVFGPGAADAIPSLFFSASATSGLYSPSADAIGVIISGHEKARIDSSGRLLVGTSSAISGGTFNNSIADQSNLYALQLAGNAWNYASIELASFQNANNTSPNISINKSRSGTTGTFGTNALIASDDIGIITFAGDDGTKFVPAAVIRVEVDGTPGANDMPGRLVFSTTADGSSSPTERMRIDSSGRLGVGTTSPQQTLDVSGTIGFNTGNTAAGRQATYALGVGDIGTVGQKARVAFEGTGSNGWLTNITFSNFTGDFYNATLQERARIDSSGRLLVGTSTARANFYNAASGQTSKIQVEGLNYQDAAFAVICNANSSDKGVINFAKSRATAVGGNTIVASGDDLGEITFQGADGGEFVQAAGIKAQVDGTPGANDMPGRLVFSTTAGGASSPTERMRITSVGNVGIGTTNPGVKLDVRGSVDSGVVNNLDLWNTSTAAGNQGALLRLITRNAANTSTSSTDIVKYQGGESSFRATDSSGFFTFHTGGYNERIRVTAAGNVGINTITPGSKLAVNGAITESTDGGTTYHNVVTAQDIGTDPNQVPLNQFLGQLAFMDQVGDVPTASSAPQDNLSINFEYVSNTSIKIRMRGTDGVVRSVTLTLS